MRSSIKILIGLLFISVFVFLGYRITNKITYKNEVKKNIKTIPDFLYQNIKGGVFTNQSLERGATTIFIYFNTDCEYCNTEAQTIQENIAKFKKSKLIFVSFESPQLIKKFAQQHQLNNYDNVYFLHDSKVTFASTFDASSIPCIVLYDKNYQLIEKIKGKTKPEILIKKLNTE